MEKFQESGKKNPILTPLNFFLYIFLKMTVALRPIQTKTCNEV